MLQLFCNDESVVRVMLFSMLNVPYLYISTFRSMCAVYNMAVFCAFWYRVSQVFIITVIVIIIIIIIIIEFLNSQL